MIGGIAGIGCKVRVPLVGQTCSAATSCIVFVYGSRSIAIHGPTGGESSNAIAGDGSLGGVEGAIELDQLPLAKIFEESRVRATVEASVGGLGLREVCGRVVCCEA